MSSYIEDAYQLMASDSGADAFVNKQVITRTLLSVGKRRRSTKRRRSCSG